MWGRLDPLLEVLDPDVVLRADGDTLAATGSRDVWGRPGRCLAQLDLAILEDGPSDD